MRGRVVLTSLLALSLAVLAGVGAPPSEFASSDSSWWMLDPLMFPTLFAGVILAAVALIASCIASGVRGAATLCLLASLSTATGLVIAAGISDHRALGFYAVFAAMVTIPAFVAVGILTRGGRT